MEKNMMIIAVVAVVAIALGGYFFLVPTSTGDSGVSSAVPAPGVDPNSVDETQVNGDADHTHDESVVIEVTAKQWEFSPNPIVVSKDHEVTLRVTSIDVPHGFSIPAFGINQRLEPNQPVDITFTPDKVGEFPLSCNIVCGVGHSGMQGTIRVEEE